jgi:hypothetical protein
MDIAIKRSALQERCLISDPRAFGAMAEPSFSSVILSMLSANGEHHLRN